MATRDELIDVSDSLLVVIDVQDSFLGKLPSAQSGELLNRICWLVELARWCEVPLVVTAEELNNDPIASGLQCCLPLGTPVFNKMVFGLADQPDILTAVVETGRKTAVKISG